MSFKELQNIKISYKSLSDDIVNEFYIPCLEKAVVYNRAVGFFSSNILLQISRGLGAFADNGGKMRLIVSPRLEPKDYEAIKNGYDLRELAEKRIIEDFDFNIDFPQRDDRFGMLSHMIATRMLEVKIVALESGDQDAMFHDKVGIMKDMDDNIIAFSGSGNETFNAFNKNYENFDVFCSWLSADSDVRCHMKEMEFNDIWNGRSKGLITIPFPQVIKDRLLTFEKGNISYTRLDEEYKRKVERMKKREIPSISVDLYDYQKKAIDEWERRGFRGIYDMATGTGKTYTGAASIVRLYERRKRLIAIVVAPYTHLVDQWCEELEGFKIKPIKCYGSEDYKKTLGRAFTNFRQKSIDFFCMVITNNSFRSDLIQGYCDKYLNDILLVVDEAHNFGAECASRTLDKDYPYRLALSATLERHGDEEGTRKLFNFFGNKCIEYDLARAIREQKLTPYNYHPVVVSLTLDEYDKYIDISKKIAACHGDGPIAEEIRKKLLIKRARIVAGAQNKLDELEKLMSKRKGDTDMLVYCGAVCYGDDGYEKASDEKKQIQRVIEMLNRLDIRSLKFTSEENNDERKSILNSFKEHQCQALVAIKCLDEGMNVPSIKTAFILASSTNPKEYIQRRGRVLRLSEGKTYADIYDFITLCQPLGDVVLGSTSDAAEKSLARKELDRLIDFSNLSRNPTESNAIISRIRDAYELDVIEVDENLYE